MGQHDLHPRAPVEEVTGGRKPAAAVVAAAGQDHDRAILQRVLFVVSRQDPSGQQGQIAPGIFHHLEQLDAVLLDHQPVDFPHLVGGEGR